MHIKQINPNTFLKCQTLLFYPFLISKTLEPEKMTFFVLLLATSDLGGSEYSSQPPMCVS